MSKYVDTSPRLKKRLNSIGFFSQLKRVEPKVAQFSVFSNKNVYTVEPLKTDTPRHKPKCPSYGGVRLTEVL